MTESSTAPAATTTEPVAVGQCPHCGFVAAANSLHARIACPECKGRIKLAWVVGKTADRIPCDDRCQYAFRPNCSCSCGGENHSVGYIRVDYVPTWVRDRDRAAHAKKAQAAATRAQTKKEQAAAAADARRIELLQRYPQLAVLADPDSEYQHDYGFMGDMRHALRRGDMTDRQAQAAADAIDRDARRERAEAERAVAAADAVAAGVRVPTGRVTFAGTIVSAKETPGSAYNTTVVKCLIVSAEGWKVWGTLPASIARANPATGTAWLAWFAGQSVSMTAELTGPKDAGDPLFGFYAKPTNASVTTPVATAA